VSGAGTGVILSSGVILSPWVILSPGVILGLDPRIGPLTRITHHLKAFACRKILLSRPRMTRKANDFLDGGLA
jgi:hypothetical protein